MIMFWKKSKADKEIDEMCNARNEMMEEIIETMKPEEEKLNDFIDEMLEKYG